jgi:hypothetical protein
MLRAWWTTHGARGTTTWTTVPVAAAMWAIAESVSILALIEGGAVPMLSGAMLKTMRVSLFRCC